MKAKNALIFLSVFLFLMSIISVFAQETLTINPKSPPNGGPSPDGDYKYFPNSPPISFVVNFSGTEFPASVSTNPWNCSLQLNYSDNRSLARLFSGPPIHDFNDPPPFFMTPDFSLPPPPYQALKKGGGSLKS